MAEISWVEASLMLSGYGHAGVLHDHEEGITSRMSVYSATIQPPLQGAPLSQGPPAKAPAAERAHAEAACLKQCRLLAAEQGLQPRHLLRCLIAVRLYQQLLPDINSTSRAAKCFLYQTLQRYLCPSPNIYLAHHARHKQCCSHPV